MSKLFVQQVRLKSIQKWALKVSKKVSKQLWSGCGKFHAPIFEVATKTIFYAMFEKFVVFLDGVFLKTLDNNDSGSVTLGRTRIRTVELDVMTFLLQVVTQISGNIDWKAW